METKEYRTVDKSEWPRGEWDDEPDKIQFTDEATGLPCLIVRGPVGALCGYVGVAEGHRCFEQEYSSIDSDVDVHGGLTFSGFCAESDDETQHICHVPGPGEPKRVWWLGFDCAHSGDIAPEMMKWRESRGIDYGSYFPTSYKTLAYVKREVAKLARQLA